MYLVFPPSLYPAPVLVTPGSFAAQQFNASTTDTHSMTLPTQLDLIIGAMALGSSMPTISGLTVNGVPATEIYQNNATGPIQAGAFFYIRNPSPGATVNVSITASVTMIRSYIAIWGINRAIRSAQALASAASNASPGAATLNTTRGAAVFAIAWPGNANATHTWTNLTEDVDQLVTGSSSRTWTAAHASGTPNQISLSPSVAHSTSDTNRGAFFISVR
jgi:hypothetical protein